MAQRTPTTDKDAMIRTRDVRGRAFCETCGFGQADFVGELDIAHTVKRVLDHVRETGHSAMTQLLQTRTYAPKAKKTM